MDEPELQDEDVLPESEQSELDERNARNKQAEKNTTPVNNTPNEPDANIDSLEKTIPPEPDPEPPEPDFF